MHVAVIGTGKVGRMTLMYLAHESWITELTLVDIVPHLAEAVAKEIGHSIASTRIPMKIYAYDKVESVKNADIVLVTVGTPRNSEIKDRTALIAANTKIIKNIAETVAPENPNAKYVIATNPVDAMAMIFKKFSKENYVISTGTNLDSQRFRSELAKNLNVPITDVEGFVGGEHGTDAVFLWSTVRIKGKLLDDYLREEKKILDKQTIVDTVKQIPKLIINVIGGTTHGPATSFRDILRSIALNDNKILSVAAPYETPEIPEPVMLGLPRMVGKNIDHTLESFITEEEKKEIRNAAKKIWITYQKALDVLKKKT